MHVKRPLIVFVSVASIVLSIPVLAADVTVTVETNGVQREMFLTEDKLCFRDAEGIMVFDAGEQRLTWVDLQDKTVREITQQELKQLSSMAGAAGGKDQADAMSQYKDAMAEARKQAAAAMANSDMSDEQRKMAQQYMDKALGGPAAADASPKRRYVPTGKSHEFNGRKCTGYTIEEGGASVLLDTLQVLCGGRIAEERKTGDISSGASMDIQQATQFARHMILEWGMSKRLGFVGYAGTDTRDAFIPEREYSEETARIVDEEVKQLIDDAYSSRREDHRRALAARGSDRRGPAQVRDASGRRGLTPRARRAPGEAHRGGPSREGSRQDRPPGEGPARRRR